MWLRFLRWREFLDYPDDPKGYEESPTKGVGDRFDLDAGNEKM